MAEGQLVNVEGDAWKTTLADRVGFDGPELPVLCLVPLLLSSGFPPPDSDGGPGQEGKGKEP